MNRSVDSQLRQHREQYDTQKRDERKNRNLKRAAGAVGAAALVGLGFSAATHHEGDLLAEAGTAVASGAIAMSRRKDEKHAAEGALLSARSAADISMNDPNLMVESWVIKALPEAEADEVLLASHQSTSKLGHPSPDSPPNSEK